MTELLGTAIRAGADAQRALLVSDLHLGGDGGAALAALDRVLAAAGDGGMPVFVLGDLFDSYVSRAQVRTGVWRAVAERFRRARDGACGRVVLLVGNRDFLLGDEFVRAAGCELVHGGYRLWLGDRDTLLLHGDELCQNDLPYQRAKRWLRSAPVRALARRLPLALAARAAERARQRSQNVVRRGDQTRFLPSRQAVARAFGLGIDRLVFGHIHRFSTGGFGAGRYHVLPAFDEDPLALEFGPLGAVAARSFAAGADPAVPLPEPPACPWSA